jgi:ribosomal protein S27AE
MRYSTKNKLSGQTRCPKCGGRVFINTDSYGWYAQCIICGYLKNLVPEAAYKTNSEIRL